MKRLATFLIALSIGGSAYAGEVTVSVRGADGKPVPDAVVMVYPNGQPSKGPIKFPWAYRISQQNIQFNPFMLVVPVGADVQFPNLDKVRHHVYSFSPGNKFEIKLYGHEENRTAKMNAPGVVAIGCNIHDQMVSFIRVVDTAYAGKTDFERRRHDPRCSCRRRNGQGLAPLFARPEERESPGDHQCRRRSRA